MNPFARAASLTAFLFAFALPAAAEAAPAAAHPSTGRSLETAQVAPAAARAASLGSTSNWAGYQASVAGPQQIRGTWFVPRASWPGRDGYSSAWVGLGGGKAGQGQLIQAGTESDTVCSAVRQHRCVAWRTSYYAWIETYPGRTQERITNLAIAPGDAIDVTVRWDATKRLAYFTLCNWRNDRCVGATRRASAPLGVAEAVVERTADAAGRPRALANVGTVNFNGVEIKGARGTHNLNAWPARRLTMFNGSTLATTSALTRYGDAFSVTYRRPA